MTRPPGAAGFGPYRDEDADALAYLARQAFGLSRQDLERSRDLYGAECLRVLREDGRPAGAAAVWSWNQWFGGRPVASRAVAFVSVDPAVRGRGLGTRLMGAVLDEARAAGCALAVLYAATQPVYAKLGFARAGAWFRYRAAPDVLARARPGGVSRRLDPLDADRLAALRRPMAQRTNGVPERTEAAWTAALHPFGDGERADVFLVGDDGYIALVPPLDGRLTVADQCLPSGAAVREAAALIAGYRSRVREVVWSGGPEDPLVHTAYEARIAVDGWEEWLLRVIDVAAALTQRGYPPGVEADLVLDVADPVLAGNDGAFHLRVAGGRGTVERRARDGDGLRLTAAALAPLFSGHLGPAALHGLGLADGDAASLAAAGVIFAGPRPWMPDRF